MSVGQGSPEEVLGKKQIHEIVEETLERAGLDGKRVLLLVPDLTRTAPIPMLFRILSEQIRRRGGALDVMVALGTHRKLDKKSLCRLVGITPDEWRRDYPDIGLLNHDWDEPGVFQMLGHISAEETRTLSGGLLVESVPIAVNRHALAYEHLLICGPVFPHEVVGFSGGYKYVFPGIGEQAFIDYSHWLGALLSSRHVIGKQDTPVRAAINRAAAMLPPPVNCLSLVVRQDGALLGLYGGNPVEAQANAAALSAQVHIVWLEQPVQRVLAMAAHHYDDLWTAAKAMYKLEPAITDGGEVIIYAPHIDEVSYTYGPLINRLGYHVRDYILAHQSEFEDIPRAVWAHSTHVKGDGAYEDGMETPRISVTLATGIPEERCRRIGLGYQDPASIDPATWLEGQGSGALVVEKAGETLYRVREVGSADV